MEFPIYPTKKQGLTEKFDLNSPSGRHKYFTSKASREIEDIKNYLDNGTFIAFMLAKKAAGKGTYSQMFQELVGTDRVKLISVGDLVRLTNETLVNDPKGKEKLTNELKDTYRGYISLDEALDSVLSRSTEKITIPTELIIALIELEIAKNPNKGIFIDGFPRTLDQVSYSLYFRQIMNFRDDPDFFILIDIAEEIIEARISSRAICSLCKTTRNPKLLPTSKIEYDKKTDEFYLICDNPTCDGFGKERLIPKEGDELGIEAIRDRLNNDGQLIEKALSLHGIPKILVRNHIPVSELDKFDDYELTPEYSYEYDEKTEKVTVKETPWIIKDDNGVESHSLLAAAALLNLIKQMHKILIEGKDPTE